MDNREFADKIREELASRARSMGTLSPEYAVGFDVAMAVAIDVITELDELGLVDETTIPKHVADYIKKCKGEELTLIDVVNKGSDAPYSVRSWIAEKKENEETFAEAWVNGYAIGGDRYYLIVAVDKEDWKYVYIDKVGSVDFTNNKEDIPTFTEEQIIAMDKRFVHLKVEIGGLA